MRTCNGQKDAPKRRALGPKARVFAVLGLHALFAEFVMLKEKPCKNAI